MPTIPTIMYSQAILVLDSSSGNPRASAVPSETANVFTTNRYAAGVPCFAGEISTSDSWTARTSFSSVPVVWQTQVIQEYRELGEALREMTELEQVDEWAIEPPVLGTALKVAAGLMANGYPAPHVFTHGPKSVVFNWPAGINNLYLTVSADKISALISTPERIAQRVDFLANEFLEPSLFLPAIQSAHLNPQVRLLTGAVSDLPELVG
jgi:hypothetical protein